MQLSRYQLALHVFKQTSVPSITASEGDPLATFAFGPATRPFLDHIAGTHIEDRKDLFGAYPPKTNPPFRVRLPISSEGM